LLGAQNKTIILKLQEPYNGQLSDYFSPHLRLEATGEEAFLST